MKRYSVITPAKAIKSGWYLPLFVFLLTPVFCWSQIVVTIPNPGCNANSTYNQNGTLNGKPRYLGSQEFPYEIVWTGARWECRFVNNTALKFVNTSNTPTPPCGEWPSESPCNNPFITIISVNGVSCCTDNDGDGAGSISCGGMDCDDNDPLEKPGQVWYKDADNDGYSDGNSLQQCLRPEGYKVAAELTSTSGDCNDHPATGGMTNPAASEICNGLDDNCNSTVDEGAPSNTYYQDADGDGFGNPTATQQACIAPGGYVTNNTDCNDGNGAIKPGVQEVCDGIDNNCNNMTDEGASVTFYRDMDGDGFGNPSVTQGACSAPSGYVGNSADCDDTNGAIHPNTIWFLDADNDNYSTGSGITQCNTPGAGYRYMGLAGTNDCNDADQTVYPGAPDICDSKDNNCNGTTDEGGMGTPPGWGAGVIGNATNTNSQFSCSAGNGGGMVLNVATQGFSGAGNADLINSNYQQRCGDVIFTAHIASSPAPGWAGIYIRESLTAGSKMVTLKTNLSSFIRREARTTTNGNKTTSQNPLYASNTWLRIERVGNTFNFYTSATGANWTFFGTATIVMNSCVYLGVFAESINAATTITASFDNVTITGGTAPLAVTPNIGFEIHEQQTMDVMLYPNPSSGDLFLKVENPDLYGQTLQVQLINAVGAQLWAGQLESLEGSEALSGLPALPDGMYWVRVQAAGFALKTIRVVIAH